ncbi:MAG TPA: penicillin-binding protein 2 [Solirubrobacterales bacterium]|nr:penicillin-binding protein 2 [Solirubrobacterales bacterium]
MSNRLALRIALFGGIALALFVVLFFRLWFLQVLNGDKYLAEAKNNRTREFRVSAPRGEILDRSGKILVANRTSLALQVNSRKLPEDLRKRRAELAQLAGLTHSSLPRLRRTMHEQLKLAPSAPVTLRRDVGSYLVFYLQENQDRYPGVTVQRVFVRRYPHETLAAHILGNVGEVSEEQLKERRYRGLQPGDEVGQDGVEYTYDHFLRGKPGITRIQVDAFGQPTRNGRLESQPPVPGDSLKLTIDSGVQAAGESALAARGLPGGFVTMNVDNGEILGLGSFPSFDPSVFTRPMTQAQVNALYRDPVAAPLTDRAIAGLYPTGSTFKLITALAALENGVITPGTPIYDGGSLTVGGESFQNAGGASYGTLTLVPALQFSSDVFFYTLGLKMWNTGDLQRWAHMLGIGRPTGLDLPGAAEGLLPSQSWRNKLYAEGETERPWSAGDNIQLATGQGDLQTNPLQMAIAYATLANGGTVVTPHVGREVDDAAGRVLREFDPGPRRHIKIDPEYRATILEGLHEAAQAPGGTSYAVFGGFPIEVAGKTGTAQRVGHADQSWYIVLAPYPNPRIVTAVTIEEGGFGAESAAPAALQILEAYFGKHSSGESGANGGSPG